MEPTEEIKIDSNASKEKRVGAKESILDFVKFAVLAVAIVLPIRLYVAQPFVVSGASMVPSFESGHYLIIDELSYRFENPKRGEVIVFRFPLQESKFLIKRVAGLPEETIEIKGNEITIKNDWYPEGFQWQQGDINPGRDTDNLTSGLAVCSWAPIPVIETFFISYSPGLSITKSLLNGGLL